MKLVQRGTRSRLVHGPHRHPLVLSISESLPAMYLGWLGYLPHSHSPVKKKTLKNPDFGNFLTDSVSVVSLLRTA